MIQRRSTAPWLTRTATQNRHQQGADALAVGAKRVPDLLMAKRRPTRKSKGEAETAALAARCGCLLDEQKRLEAMNHSQAENDAARPRCRELLESGWEHVQG